MQITSGIIGIDIGSTAIAVIGLDADGRATHSQYRYHHGQADDTLRGMLADIDRSACWRIAVTSSTPGHVRSQARVDSRLAVIRAARCFHSGFGAIMVVGGEKFGLLRFNAQGRYLGYKTNTSCAAGTGSFLDQQAIRLQLTDSGELARQAALHQGPPLKIASRCAVFAKTDLIHAQQDGHNLPAICDGLCRGLAENIFDALFTGTPVAGPVVMCGGVARNDSVVGHLSALIGTELQVHPQAHLFGAIGAALHLHDQQARTGDRESIDIADIISPRTTKRQYAFAPLVLQHSEFPDFSALDSSRFQPSDPATAGTPVEVDTYCTPARGGRLPVHLGVDIGSTSTKAVLMAADRKVLAGFYTRTAGRPLAAVQSLLEAIAQWQQRHDVTCQILGAATTGSGRKFIGLIIGADLVVDEISAHARAACELNPQVDTIIEIGGQDAKFTTLQDGAVTHAVMNSVCAAGTGSFIEEQAQLLNCRLSDFAERTLNCRSPMASDRCTVFMERDLHHYLNEGYSVEEVLTAVLHAVRENYLTKVAVEAMIGHSVMFQGATAKNKALVAAFEQRLQRPIHVSRYCHLTGALGAALMLAEQGVERTQFRGIDLWRKHIPVKREVCDLCPNHCKITLAAIDEQQVAFGFACGRDYDTRRYVDRNPSGFDLLKARKKAFGRIPVPSAAAPRALIGIPAALYLFEDLHLWQHFFKQLGFGVVTSESFAQGLEEGRRCVGSQFCAPMAALYGHIRYLQDNCDAIFLPHYLESKAGPKGVRRQYCYYTQFSVPLAAAMQEGQRCSRLLTPLVHYLYNTLHTKIQLYRALKAVSADGVSLAAVAAAYDQALNFKASGLKKLQAQYQSTVAGCNDLHVVLLGRPYTVLSANMNKGIPTIFDALGIKAFYQDMLPNPHGSGSAAALLLNTLHWQHAATILARAESVAQTQGAYPVLITSFKCSPDAFLIDYFKRIMADHRKPYLILQVDDHDASGGYETRIEAAVRAFHNHHSRSRNNRPGRPAHQPMYPPVPEHGSLTGKTLLLPNWDDLSMALIATALQREGIDARILEHHPESQQKSLRHNTGQCLPLNIIAQETIDYIELNDLDPARTQLWMPESNIACNIHLYPSYIQQVLESHAHGRRSAGVHIGPMSMRDLSLKMPLRAYFAYMFGGYLRRLGCRIRPYETLRGRTDPCIDQGLQLLMGAFAGRCTYEEALDELTALFAAIAIQPHYRPKVAIFGDLYARDNASINQDLIRFIEANGGEVLPTPYSDYMKMIARSYLRKWLIEGHYLEAISSRLILAAIKRRESFYYSYFQRILQEPEPGYDESPAQILSQYHLRPEHTGESMDNLLKVHYLTRHHPDIDLLVQVSPAFCCPALVTEAMAARIEAVTGVPIVSITYDGTGGSKNEAIIPYLTYPRTRPRKQDADSAETIKRFP